MWEYKGMEIKKDTMEIRHFIKNIAFSVDISNVKRLRTSSMCRMITVTILKIIDVYLYLKEGQCEYNNI